MPNFQRSKASRTKRVKKRNALPYLTDEAVHQIIAKTKAVGGHEPIANDLAKDIIAALAGFWVRSDLKSKQRVERQAALADKVERAASTLVQLLAQKQNIAIHFIAGEWPSNAVPMMRLRDLREFRTSKNTSPPFPSMDGLVAGLEHLRQSSAETKKLSNKWTRTGLRSTQSPMEWLTGNALPSIFEKQFRLQPGRSHTGSNEAAGGPCVRFVKATIQAAGLTYDAESIVRAMSRNRTKASRRKLR